MQPSEFETLSEASASSLTRLVRARTHHDPSLLRTPDALESQLAYIEQTRRDHRYSKAVQTLFDLVTGYIPNCEAAWRGGEPAAWMSGGVWSPLFYACGTLPISINEMGRLGSADALTAAEDHFHLPKESCSMVGGVLCEFHLRLGRTVKRLATLDALCEPQNIAWDLLKDDGFDIYRVEALNRLNAHDDPERLALMEQYLQRDILGLSVWLQGHAVDDRILAVEIRRINRLFKKVRKILQLRLKNPFYLRSLATMYVILGTAHYFGKPGLYEEMLDGLIEELESSAEVPSPTGKIVRLAWVGARGQEFGVYKAIDDAGGAITQWHTPDEWTKDYREDLPPLAAYADHIISARMVGSPIRRLKNIEEDMSVYGARGILFHSYVGCSFGVIHKEIQRDYFQKRGVPSIALEGSFQVGRPTGQLLTRIRAFMEMFS
jgi:benzoyl-CoA reductase/2-hydroxyglutaryl-CoA dehydratase subunit BcrC/BadD/HgdB